jgi:DNA-binding transcriptional ArsR family regulator
MSLRLLEGQIESPEQERIRELERENGALRDEVERLQLDLKHARSSSSQAVSAIRRQLGPLHAALKLLFGEIDKIEPVDGTGSSSDESRKNPVWEAWKQRLGQTPARVIDALLVHGELNTQQLAIATGLHRTTIPKAIYVLNKAGLISKNGGRFSLKEI